MISYADALTILRSCAKRTRSDVETVAISEMCGRVLAADLIAPEDVPPFDNSAMDGFAISTADVGTASEDAPVDLSVIEMLAAGDGGIHKAGPGQCFSIMTGAVLPGGCDAVVRIEDVEVLRWITGVPAAIRVRRSVATGENIRRRGTDFSNGSRLASVGELMTPHHVMAFASAGVGHVSVFRRPRVLLISTGRELAPPDRGRLERGEIRNSTGPLLQSLLPLMGCDVVRAETIADDVFVYRDFLHRMLNDEDLDIIVSTGAVSVGEFDFVKSVLLAEKAHIHFHKVAVRPGKPLLFAELASRSGRPVWFFGIPGNPVSTAVAMRFFLSPFMRAHCGRPVEVPLRLRLSKAVRKPEGLRCFFKAAFLGEAEETEVECLEGQASYLVRSLLSSHAWAVLPEGGNSVARGKVIEVFGLFDDAGGISHGN